MGLCVEITRGVPTWGEIKIGAWIGNHITWLRDVFVENVVVGKGSESQNGLGSCG